MLCESERIEKVSKISNEFTLVLVKFGFTLLLPKDEETKGKIINVQDVNSASSVVASSEVHPLLLHVHYEFPLSDCNDTSR